jgi:hypothetical protein
MDTETPTAEHTPGDNPDELSRLLEIELIQKRAAWKRALARNKGLKSLSLLFLCLVFFAGLGAFYFVYLRANDQRQQHPPATLETSRRR